MMELQAPLCLTHPLRHWVSHEHECVLELRYLRLSGHLRACEAIEYQWRRPTYTTFRERLLSTATDDALPGTRQWLGHRSHHHLRGFSCVWFVRDFLEAMGSENEEDPTSLEWLGHHSCVGMYQWRAKPRTVSWPPSRFSALACLRLLWLVNSAQLFDIESILMKPSSHIYRRGCATYSIHHHNRNHQFTQSMILRLVYSWRKRFANSCSCLLGAKWYGLPRTRPWRFPYWTCIFKYFATDHFALCLTYSWESRLHTCS